MLHKLVDVTGVPIGVSSSSCFLDRIIYGQFTRLLTHESCFKVESNKRCKIWRLENSKSRWRHVRSWKSWTLYFSSPKPAARSNAQTRRPSNPINSLVNSRRINLEIFIDSRLSCQTSNLFQFYCLLLIPTIRMMSKNLTSRFERRWTCWEDLSVFRLKFNLILFLRSSFLCTLHSCLYGDISAAIDKDHLMSSESGRFSCWWPCNK